MAVFEPGNCKKYIYKIKIRTSKIIQNSEIMPKSESFLKKKKKKQPVAKLQIVFKNILFYSFFTWVSKNFIKLKL